LVTIYPSPSQESFEIEMYKEMQTSTQYSFSGDRDEDRAIGLCHVVGTGAEIPQLGEDELESSNSSEADMPPPICTRPRIGSTDSSR
jgi:hypothetical protein